MEDPHSHGQLTAIAMVAVVALLCGVGMARLRQPAVVGYILAGLLLGPSALGLVLSSFYDDITQSFGVLYGLVILMMLPNIAYFIPTWDPAWMQAIPTYAMLEGFKEILLPAGDMDFVLIASTSYLAAGLLLFLFANSRFKKTLTI